MAAGLACSVLALAAVACGGGDDAATPSSTTRADRPGSSASVAPGGTPGGTGAGGSQAGAPAGAATTAGGGTTATTGRRGSGPAPTAPGTATTTPPAAAAAVTPPGRYRYASTGSFSSGALGEQPRNGESVLTVDPPSGADQHSVRQAPGKTTEQVVRFQADGIYLVVLKQTEQGLSKEFRPTAPVLVFPYGASPGRAWSWRISSTDGLTTVQADLRVDRTEAVTVGSDQVPAVVVQVALATSGDLVSSGSQTLWVAENRRLVLREQSTMEGSYGTFRFRSVSEERILSLSPS